MNLSPRTAKALDVWIEPSTIVLSWASVKKSRTPIDLLVLSGFTSKVLPDLLKSAGHEAIENT
jgi:hypothetical protein